MRFKIICVGWQCGRWFAQTLRSLEEQSVDNWDIQIRYDGGDDAGLAIHRWCAERDERWNCTLNERRMYAVENQVRAIEQLAPADDDVVVWLDLDGDTFAHADVLKRLAEHYDGDAEPLVTFGSYRPIPDLGTSTMAEPIPDHVVANRSYRQETLTAGCHWNHLRSMKGSIVKAIPPDQFRWPKGPKAGSYYGAGVDYIFMTAALELANGRHKFIDEVLYLYRHPLPTDEVDRGYHNETAACTQNYLRRPPLAPLAKSLDFIPIISGDARLAARILPDRRPPGWREVYLPAEARRLVLRDIGHAYGLKAFIETGTHDGATPMFLKDDFVELHTIELGEDAYRRARRLFSPFPQVHCWHGDSSAMLPKVLAQIEQPALVWLDGHYSGGTTAHGKDSTPVRDELRILFEDGRRHVILVDDARCFEGGAEHPTATKAAYEHYLAYPSLQWVEEYAGKHGYDFDLVDDIMRLTPR